MDFSAAGPYYPSPWYSGNRLDEWGLGTVTTNPHCPFCGSLAMPRAPWGSSSHPLDGLWPQGLSSALFQLSPGLSPSPPSSLVELLAPPADLFQTTPDGGAGSANIVVPFGTSFQSLGDPPTALGSLTEDLFFPPTAANDTGSSTSACLVTREGWSTSTGRRTPTPAASPGSSSTRSDSQQLVDEDSVLDSLSEESRFVVVRKKRKEPWKDIVREYEKQWGPTTPSTLGMRLSRLKNKNPVIRRMFPERKRRKRSQTGGIRSKND